MDSDISPGGFIKEMLRISGLENPTREQVAQILGDLTEQFILNGANKVQWIGLEEVIKENEDYEQQEYKKISRRTDSRLD